MNKALIVIDAQEDFTRGALRNEEAIKALDTINRLVKYARANCFEHVIYTADTHTNDYLNTQEGKNLPVSHCISGTEGWELCPEVLRDAEKDLLICKPSFGYNGWQKLPFEDLDEIVMCGFCTDICVIANFQVIKSQFPEIPIAIIRDACAGVTPELHEAALKVMKSCQANIQTMREYTSEEAGTDDQ